MTKSKGNVAVAPKPTKSKVFEPAVNVLRTIQVNPIELILTDKFRGRSKPVADDELCVLADSLRIRQDQPIQVRESNPGKYEVIFGNTRTLAGRKVIEGFTTTSGKVIESVPNFTIRAEVVDIDDEEAVMRNITENTQRVQTTAIDDCLNHEMLRTEYKMSDAAITRLYGYGHQASVTSLKKLLTLPESIQEKIHTGNMTKQAGFVLVDWCRKKDHMVNDGTMCNAVICDAVLANVQGGEDIGNVGSSEVMACIKQWEKTQAAPTPVVTTNSGTTTITIAPVVDPNGTGRDSNNVPIPQTTVYPITLKELKDTLTEFMGLPDVSAKMNEFCAVTLSFLKGETEKDGFYDWVSVNIV